MKRITIAIALLFTTSICHAAYQTDSLTLTGLKNKAVVATDANGKLIEGSAPDLSAYAKLTDALQSITALKFITSGGTLSQFVKGDGSLDSTTYLTSSSSLDPSKVTQSSTYRFVSDTEKGVWNGKQAAITTGTTAQYLKGDLSLGTFPTALSSFTNDLGNYGGFLTSASTLDPTKISGYPTDGTKYLSGDGTWKVVSGGGGTWGSITGTLSAQTDLQTALNAKANYSFGANNFTGTGTITGGTLYAGTSTANTTLTQYTSTAVPAYTNPGGTGNRTSSITVTSTLTVQGSGTFQQAVDGDKTSAVWWWAGVAASGKYFRFDFGAGASKVINEVKWYQSNATAQGVWQWQGSNDGTNWTNIGANFNLGGVATLTDTAMSANTTGYRYYQILGISGNTSSSPFQYETEFKIDNYISVVAPSIQGYKTDGATADDILLQPKGGVAYISGNKGIGLSAASGVLTIGGHGMTNNENLTLDFETIATNK